MIKLFLLFIAALTLDAMSAEIPIRGTLQAATASGATDPSTGLVSVTITVPSGGRWVKGGDGWFGAQTPGDRVTAIAVKVGGATVATYHDSAVATENQGWQINPVQGFLKVDRFAEPALLPEGAQLVVTGKKVTPIADTLYFNLDWAKP